MKLFIEAHFSGFKSGLYLKEMITITNFPLEIVCIIAHKFLHNATFSYEHTQVAFVLQMYACKVSICTSKINKGLHKFEGVWHNLVWLSIFKHLGSHIPNIKEFISTFKSGTFIVNILCNARERRSGDIKSSLFTLSGLRKVMHIILVKHKAGIWIIAVNV